MAMIVPTVEAIGDEALTNSIIDRSITEIQDDIVTTLAPYALASCTSLKKGVFGAVTEVLNNSFAGDTALEELDFHATVEFDASALQDLPNLKTLILRSNTMCDASSGALLSYTPIDEGTGYIYVPAVLVDEYKSDFIWSSYYDQIRAIEDYPEVCSTAGKLWEKQSFTFSPQRIAYHDGLYVFGASNGIYYSEDGFEWTQSNYKSSAGNVAYLTCVNGMWFAGGTQSKSWYSEDGKTWTQSNLPYYVTAVAYANNLWVAGTGSASYGLWYSADGKTWTQSNLTSGKPNNKSIIAHYNGLLVAAMSTGVYYSEDGMTWVAGYSPFSLAALWNLNGVWIGASTNYGLFYSDDGKTWSRSNVTSYTFNGVAYQNGVYVAAGIRLYYSTDGKTWTFVQSVGDAHAVSCANGLFVAIDLSRFMYSYEGINWVNSTPCSGANSSAQAVYCGDRWIANTSTEVYYSE